MIGIFSALVIVDEWDKVHIVYAPETAIQSGFEPEYIEEVVSFQDLLDAEELVEKCVLYGCDLLHTNGEWSIQHLAPTLQL